MDDTTASWYPLAISANELTMRRMGNVLMNYHLCQIRFREPNLGPGISRSGTRKAGHS